MPNPVAIVAPSVALSILKEGVSLCQSIMAYRQQSMQVELAREQMHRQADLQMAEIEQKFQKDMQRLESISKAFHTTLEHTRKEFQTKAQLIHHLENQIVVMIQTLASPQTPDDIRIGLNQTLQIMTSQQSALINEFVQTSGGAVNAFAIFADTVRTSPRTFTDVR